MHCSNCIHGANAHVRVKMIPGMNPKKMQQMINQMGISQVELDAT